MIKALPAEIGLGIVINFLVGSQKVQAERKPRLHGDITLGRYGHVQMRVCALG